MSHPITPYSTQRFFHGSMIHLPIDSILVPQPQYRETWGHTAFYPVLERYRPKGRLAHHEAVFLCASAEDIDLAGGCTEWLFEVQPMGSMTRHDLNWSSAISGAVDDGAPATVLANLAQAYWQGIAHDDGPVWEYLTPSSRIIAVEPY